MQRIYLYGDGPIYHVADCIGYAVGNSYCGLPLGEWLWSREKPANGRLCKRCVKKMERLGMLEKGPRKE